MNRHDLRPGDVVYRWWDSGIGMDPQVLTVVRVNRLTVTVETSQGHRFRMSPSDIVGRWSEE